MGQKIVHILVEKGRRSVINVPSPPEGRSAFPIAQSSHFDGMNEERAHNRGNRTSHGEAPKLLEALSTGKAKRDGGAESKKIKNSLHINPKFVHQFLLLSSKASSQVGQAIFDWNVREHTFHVKRNQDKIIGHMPASHGLNKLKNIVHHTRRWGRVLKQLQHWHKLFLEAVGDVVDG